MQPAIQAKLQAALSKRQQQQRLRGLTTITALNATEVAIGQRRYTSFSSNDYLGLSHHPQVVNALRNADHAGSRASPLVTGFSAAHADLAAQLAEFVQRDRVLLFSSAFAANVGALASLGGHYEQLWLDRLAHASLLSGARQSGAYWRRFAHQGYQPLAQKLAADTQTRLVVAESVYSMDGDTLDQQGFRSVLGVPGCDGYVDDAHGFGVMGEQGSGISANFSQRELAVVSLAFGKACGVAGGAVAVTADVADYLINFCPEFIYSTAMPAVQARAIQAAVIVLQSTEGEQLRQKLQANIAQFRQQCAELQLPIEPSSHAIQTLIVGTDNVAMQQSLALNDLGIWCTAIRPPTVPEGSARLRITLTAAHSSAQIQHLTQALAVTQQQGNSADDH